jgi:hypothetical protein
MNHGDGALHDIARYQLCSRDLASARTQPKHRAGEMFSRVDRAFFTENFLRAWNALIVSPLMTEVSESGTVFGAGQCGHPSAVRAAMQIQAQPRMPSAERRDGRRQNIVDVGIVLKQIAKAIFHYDGNV